MAGHTLWLRAVLGNSTAKSEINPPNIPEVGVITDIVLCNTHTTSTYNVFLDMIDGTPSVLYDLPVGPKETIVIPTNILLTPSEQAMVWASTGGYVNCSISGYIDD